MILARPLPDHAVIGICSPAGPVREEKLRRAVAELERGGHRVVLSAHALDSEGFLSASDDNRLRDLHELFGNSQIDAVFCSRGGSGTGRLLGGIDAKLIAESRKPFLGFSDVTALQWALYRQTGFVTYSGPLAVEWDGSLSGETIRQCWAVLRGEDCGNLFDGFSKETFAHFEVLRGGEADGVLMPGNLALITTLLGTPYLPALRDSILFIEDISEAPYRFDRMLFHLRNAGVLKALRGLIVGDFGWSRKEGEFEMQRKSLLEAAAGTDCPIMINLPYGHGRDRMTLPIGMPVRVGFGKPPVLRLLGDQTAI